MRRSDREITDRAEIDAIIRGAEVCHLGMVAGGEPYVVPVSFGYDGHSLYLHTAPKGRKIEPLQGGARVCCQLERGVELVRDARDACRWTFAYESVIGLGTAEELTTPEAKQAGLNHIMRQYSGRDWRMPEGQVVGTRVWRIALDTVTAKRSRRKASDDAASTDRSP